MDYIVACILLVLWYVRPQDIIGVLSGLSLVKYSMYAGIVGTIRRTDGFSLRKLFVTPIDYLVSCYLLWAIYATTDHTAAAKEVFTYFCFHFVTVLALTNWKRLEIYINWWMGCIGVVALLAVSTHWGFELVKGSAELTAIFHDRLSLNTWIFRNPNALAHGIIVLIPAGISWFLLSGAKHRILGGLTVALCLHCVFLTQSKGAFMAGAGALILVLIFKRPVGFQLMVLILASSAGFGALKMLPRMDTLNKNDEGIMGRMIVWQQAKASLENTKIGEGLHGFHGYVEVRFTKLHRTIRIPIATHGTYVRQGADLGYVGLMLYAGLFYAGLRLLLQCSFPAGGNCARIQRTLFALVICTALSVWVVDRAYQMDYFLLSGLLSAFHRLCMPDANLNLESGVPDKDIKGAIETTVKGASTLMPIAHSGFHTDREQSDDMGSSRLKWRRLGVIDLLAMYVLLEIILYYWNLLSTDFIVF